MTVLFQAGLNAQNANWVRLTSALEPRVTFQNGGTASMYVKATPGSAPTSTDGAIEYPPLAKEIAINLSRLFPGQINNYTLWAYSKVKTKAIISSVYADGREIWIEPKVPREASIENKWIQLTESNVDRITFQNLGVNNLYVKATNGANEPSNASGALEYPGAAKENYVRLSDLFPGISGANRLWAYAESSTTVFVSHLDGVNKTVAVAPNESYSNARIAHSLNWLSGGTAVASTTASGYFANAPLNTLTYEMWKPNIAGGTWEYDHGTSATVDYCTIAAHALGSSGSTISIQYYNGSAWVDVIASTAIENDSPIMGLFNPITAQRWRVNILAANVAPSIGVIKFGSALQMPQAIYGGHSPITMARQTILRTNYSETGEFLGRTKQRVQLGNTYSWTHLKADWMRANWPTLQKAIEAEPFWIAWRPSDYGEVGFSQVDSVPIPQNMGIKDFMSVEMTTRARAWD